MSSAPRMAEYTEEEYRHQQYWKRDTEALSMAKRMTKHGYCVAARETDRWIELAEIIFNGEYTQKEKQQLMNFDREPSRY